MDISVTQAIKARLKVGEDHSVNRAKKRRVGSTFIPVGFSIQLIDFKSNSLLKGTPYRGVRRVGAEPRETARRFTVEDFS